MGRKVENAYCRSTEGLVDGMGGVNLLSTCFGLARIRVCRILLSYIVSIVTDWLYWINCNSLVYYV
jgi:hypothetical protein